MPSLHAATAVAAYVADLGHDVAVAVHLGSASTIASASDLSYARASASAFDLASASVASVAGVESTF